MQDKILWILNWQTVSLWGYVSVWLCVKWKVCHNIFDELLPHCPTYISNVPRPIIIETPLILMFRLGMKHAAIIFAPKCSQYLIYASLQTNGQLHYPRWKTKSFEHSIGAPYWNGVVTMCSIVLPTMAVSTSVVGSCNPVSIQLQYWQH